ncbi:MSF1-like protein [Plasmodium ovale curtisi]|uniref:MSF1-like protein n=1 Tax=Plasmodium ovale curtisi TaxID=864141 RepID=A0A1A8WXB7_PLAOA|nr:MSF1-like protein [Plasmodium ovale curtisi]SBS96526.1 MSF1-like protein [Plasmodium ovale curtisi]
MYKNLFNIDGKGIAIENIEVDLKTKNLTVRTVNYTLSPLVNITETCSYFQKGEEENHTCYRQKTTLSINGFGYMKNFIENVFLEERKLRAHILYTMCTIINAIREKSKQGIRIMNETIKRNMKENIHIGSNSYVNTLGKEKKGNPCNDKV